MQALAGAEKFDAPNSLIKAKEISVFAQKSMKSKYP